MVKKVSFVDKKLFENEDKNQSASVSSKTLSDKNILDRFLIESDDKKSLQLWIEHIRLVSDIALTKETLVTSMLTSVIQLDDIIEKMVNNILHHPQLQSLEASWRSIEYLIDQQEKNDKIQKIKIKILNCSWVSLSKDLDKSIEYNQSKFYSLINSEEFDRAGGEPFGLIIGDYTITNKNISGSYINDIDTLKVLALVCAASFSPLILSVDPTFFGVDNLDDLGGHIDLAKHFRQPEFRKWLSLREMSESRFIGLTLPNVLMRAPYTDDGKRSEGFRFRERIKDVQKDHLWGNAAYVFGGVILRAFAESGWFGLIRGMQPGVIGKGLVSDLAVMPFDTNQHAHRGNKPSINLQIGSRGEAQLAENGFIPLSRIPGCDHLVFYSNSSVHKPKETEKSLKEIANDKLSCMLQYTLCSSRFGHYVKVLAREKIGSYADADACEDDLQQWIMQYTSSSDSAADSIRAKFPLSHAEVKVKDVPGKSGHYYTVIQVQPHFQLGQLASNIQLVTELT